jgi:hypothetical protein
MYQKESPIDPLELIRRFRQNYTNLFKLWKTTGKTPEGVRLYTPQEEPIREDKLPEALQAQLQAYRKANPKQKISLRKYMRTVNGQPKLVIEDESDLPDEGALLTLSQTVTLNSAEAVEIVTELIVAERA